MLKLHGLPGACPMAVHIILEHLELDYEMVMVDRDKLMEPEHLAVNPMGQARRASATAARPCWAISPPSPAAR